MWSCHGMALDTCGFAPRVTPSSIYLFILVTGNANYFMAKTSLSIFGFTQPHTALPIIQDAQNNVKGFTSRFIWYFPEPVFAKLRHTKLTEEENEILKAFQKNFGEFLASFCYNKSISDIYNNI